MRRAARVDANQKPITDNLRQVAKDAPLDLTVDLIHTLGKGRPDMMIGVYGLNLLFELKVADEGLTDDEVSWHCGWRGQVDVARTASDIIRIAWAHLLGINCLYDERKIELLLVLRLLRDLE